MVRQKAFQTAAARRKANPVEWLIDDVRIRLKADADIFDAAETLEAVQQPISDDESQIKAAMERRDMMVAMIRKFVDERDLDAFDSISDNLDIGLCSELAMEVLTEYTGQENPTQQRSSSDGSLETGSPLTAGVLPGGSTQAV